MQMISSRFACLLLATAVCGGCASMYTQQAVNLAVNLKPGMSPAEATAVMGPPIKSEFSRGVTEWHYCKTGTTADQFVALFFEKDKLIETRNYTVTLGDIGGAYGACENFVKMGNYREPDSVVEIRLRYRNTAFNLLRMNSPDAIARNGVPDR